MNEEIKKELQNFLESKTFEALAQLDALKGCSTICEIKEDKFYIKSKKDGGNPEFDKALEIAKYIIACTFNID